MALTPIYIVSFPPAVVTLAPGIDLSVGLALVRIAGVAMLFRALMSGDPVGIEGFVAVGATLVYSALALSFAARSFSHEDVGEPEGGSRDRMPWWTFQLFVRARTGEANRACGPVVHRGSGGGRDRPWRRLRAPGCRISRSDCVCT